MKPVNGCWIPVKSTVQPVVSESEASESFCPSARPVFCLDMPIYELFFEIGDGVSREDACGMQTTGH